MNELFQNKKIHGGVMLVVVALAAYLFILTVNEIKEYRYIGAGLSATNTISVSGEGEVFAVPDIGTFSFSVEEENTVASVAQNAAAKKTNDIVDYLKKNSVDEKDIKTTNYSFYPRYEYERTSLGYQSGERTFVGFTVTQTIEVKVRDTDKAGELLSKVGDLGATSVSGLSFTLDDDDAVQNEAREKAITNAEEKAKVLAKQLGVRLVRVVSFSEGYGGSPVYFKGLEATDASYGVGGNTPQIPVGENKVLSNVTITYEIR